MARETAKKRLDVAGVEPADKIKGHPVFALKDVVIALSGSEEPANMTPFARKAHYQAELEKLKLGHESGELLTRFEVEREITGIFAGVSQFLDTLPDQLERHGVDSDQLGYVETLLDDLRTKLHKDIANGIFRSAVADTG